MEDDFLEKEKGYIINMDAMLVGISIPRIDFYRR
jgi:hypothetical protein